MKFAHLELICHDDGTSDLLLSDDEGVGLPEPYDKVTMSAALVRISEAIGGYLQRMVDS